METVVITGGALMTDEIDTIKEGYLFPFLMTQGADYKQLIGGRGLRYLTEATKMSLVTTNLAKDNADIQSFNSERCGIVVATNFSSLATIVSFDMTTLEEGPRAVSAMQGPNLVLNATAAKLGIHFEITGFNTTISSGRVASLDAIEYGCEMIKKNEVDRVIVTGVEEKTKAYEQWLIDANIAKEEELSQVKQFSGTVILESKTHALARGAKIYGSVLDFSAVYNETHLIDEKAQKENEEDYRYMADQLIDSYDDVKSVCLSDNRFSGDYKKESEYVKAMFRTAKVTSTYDVFGGELFGATGMAQLIHSLHSFEEGKGIVFCNDWTGNYRGMLIEKYA